MSFFNELKRRNVFKVGVAYAAATWLLLQIVDLVLDNIHAPDWIIQVFMLAMAVGFPIAIIIAWAFEVTPGGVKRQKEVDRNQSIAPETGKQLNRGILMILVVAMVFLISDKFRDEMAEEPGVTATKSESESGADSPSENSKSIAVLPFVNMSSDPEQEYFADGISEELLNALATIGDLKVAGRTSSFAFKGKNEDLLAIGKVLRVNHILEGSVRKSGDRIRITAQLIKVEDGFHMWSETYDRELTDIFIIQDEISAAILTQLKTQLLGEPSAIIQTDPRTYDLYLLAKQRMAERNQASLEMAQQLLTEATGIDPDYAPVLVELGITTILLSEKNYGTLPSAETRVNAKQYIEKALQLAPQNAEAIAALGLYFLGYELDHQKAITELKRALAINPNLLNANNWLAIELQRTGKLQEGLKLRENIFQRDPLYAPNVTNLQQMYMVMGQTDKALVMLEGLHAYLPDDVNIISSTGQVYFMSGQLANAREPFQRAFARNPTSVSKSFWYTLFLIAARQYETAAQVAPKGVAPIALSRLGQSEEALITGNEAISNGLHPKWYFQTLVENGQFTQLVQKLETIWPDLDEYSATWPAGNGYGNDSMGYIAHAYREVGNLEKFGEAMERFKTTLDSQLAQGANNWVFNTSRAHFAALSGDNDAAIGFLKTAFDQGGYLDVSSDAAWPVFKPLDGDPSYEAAKAAMQKRWVAEMEKMKTMQEQDS